jgi:hypothetical protein
VTEEGRNHIEATGDTRYTKYVPYTNSTHFKRQKDSDIAFKNITQ